MNEHHYVPVYTYNPIDSYTYNPIDLYTQPNYNNITTSTINPWDYDTVIHMNTTEPNPLYLHEHLTLCAMIKNSCRNWFNFCYGFCYGCVLQ